MKRFNRIAGHGLLLFAVLSILLWSAPAAWLVAIILLALGGLLLTASKKSGGPGLIHR